MRLAGAILALLIAIAAGVPAAGDCSCVSYLCYEDVTVTGLEGLASHGNGVYTLTDILSGRPVYTGPNGSDIDWWEFASCWTLNVRETEGSSQLVACYINMADTPTPPETGWQIYEGTEPPVPILSGGQDCRASTTTTITVAPISGDTGEDGTTATFQLLPYPAPEYAVTVPLSLSDPSEATVPDSVVLRPGRGVWVPVTVTGVNDDIDDGDVAYTIITGDPASADSYYDALGAGDIDDVAATNTDDDTRGITVGPTAGLTTTEAGGTAAFTVVLNSEPTDTVTIAMASSAPSEGTVSPATLTFTASTWDEPQTVTVTGVDDDVDDGDHAYTLVTAPASGGDYAGIDASDVSATNADNDTRGITVVPTSGLMTTEGGGTATFTVVLDSEPTDTVTIAISTSDPSEGTASPSSLEFTPGDWDTPLIVTVTGIDDTVVDGDAIYFIATAPVAGGGDYTGMDASDVSVTNADDDTVPIPHDDPRQDVVMDQSAIVDSLTEVRRDECGVYRLMLRESTPVWLNVLANDDENGSCGEVVIHEIATAPAYGTATIDDPSGGALIRYAPAQGYVGPDEFTYRTRDACGNVSDEIATVYLQMIPNVAIEDVYLPTCSGRSIEFAVVAADLWIDEENPDEIPFTFEIIDGPANGVLIGDPTDVTWTSPSTVSVDGTAVPILDAIETASIKLVYAPTAGFLGQDAIRVRFADPFGNEATARVDFTVAPCPGEEPTIVAAHGDTIRIIMPEGAMLSEVSSSLVSRLDGNTYPEAISAASSEPIHRIVLGVDTGVIPPGDYLVSIQLAGARWIELTLRVEDVDG